MRQITKAAEPNSLTERRAELKATNGVTDYYSALTDSASTSGRRVRCDIQKQSLKEQGHLCAYTNVRIGPGSCHFEHMYPQKLGGCPAADERDPLTAIQYSNIVLCFPDTYAPECAFGAHPKRNWPCPSQEGSFVRPTDPDVESRFTYAWDGGIAAANPADQVAKETIKKLCLDQADLKLLRKESLKPFKSLTNEQELKKRLLHAKRRSEYDEEFCVAKEQLISKILNRVQQRRKAISGRRRP